MISLEAVYMVFAFYIVLLLILYRIFRGGDSNATPIYKVTVKLKNPSRLAAWLVKIRAGRIAGEFEYMFWLSVLKK